MIECVVLDFDGTFTDVAVEGAPFEATYRDLLADLVGADISGAWEQAQAEVTAEAPELGWVYEGHIVAPADADPYIRAGAVALKIFDRLGRLARHPELRGAFTRPLYDASYARSATAFRPDAATVLDGIAGAGLPVYIVSNADTERVKQKLAQLPLAHRERLHIRGNARKYAIEPPRLRDARFDALGETLFVEGLKRPVLLRRGAYYQALLEIWAQTGARPETTFAAGDIYELDLALPASLGAMVHLVERAGVHSYERVAIAALGERGATSSTLLPLLDRVRSLRG